MRALVIDDSRTMRRIISGVLQSLGFETVEAGDGRQALDVLEAGTAVDLACIDWNMPVMDGLSFLKALRQMSGGHVPKVIFCTTEGDMSRITEALAAGADEYIMKPFDEEVLASKLEIVGFFNQEKSAA